MAARSSPQLRLFRNDFGEKNASLALRLTGTKSNRDAVGARVTVETDQVRGRGGAGGLGVHLPALEGAALRPGPEPGHRQGRDPLAERRRPDPHRRCRRSAGSSVGEGSDALRREPYRAPSAPRAGRRRFRAGDGATPAGRGSTAGPRSRLLGPRPGRPGALISAWRGRPALLLFWATWRASLLAALEALRGQGAAFAAAGVPVLAVAGRPGRGGGQGPRGDRGHRAPGGPRGPEMAGAYSILSRYLFDRREELRLPTLLLLEARERW